MGPLFADPTCLQLRVVPSTANSEANNTLSKEFAYKLLKYHTDGDLIVYCDETNFSLYSKRSQGRAVQRERATVVLPASKGANMQLQCTVSSVLGVVSFQLERGSTRMAENAAFVEVVIAAAKKSAVYQTSYADKKIVVVFDNAPAHRQTKGRVEEDVSVVLLHLTPYSPMCNPIKVRFL